MTFVNVSSSTYTRTHTAAYVSDKIQTLLKTLVREYGLNPDKVVTCWSGSIDQAVRKWLISGHLTSIVIEFYKPGASKAEVRWDFPINYDGDSNDEDLWVDRNFFRETISKSKSPSLDCDYKIILCHNPGEPYVAGLSSTTFKSIEGLVGRRQGTVISTRDVMASVKVYQ